MAETSTRILVLNSLDLTYGSTRRMRRFLGWFKELGYHVTYMEPNYAGEDPSVITMPQQNSAAGFMTGNVYRAWYASIIGYDVLFTQTFTPLTAPCILAARARRKPIIVDWDDLSGAIQANKLRKALVDACERGLPRLADAVITPNRYLREIAEAYAPGTVSYMLSHGVDCAVFDPAAHNAAEVKRQEGLEGKRVLGFLASFTTGGVGDLDVIIGAYHRIRRRREDVALLIIGGGPLLQEYTEATTATGVQDVTFTGFLRSQQDVARYLSAVDLALIYMRDNLGNRMKTCLKMFEYLAMDRKVVGHMVGETGDLWRDHVLTCEDNVDAFEAAILEALAGGHPGRSTREMMVREHDWSARGLQFAKLMERILARV